MDSGSFFQFFCIVKGGPQGKKSRQSFKTPSATIFHLIAPQIRRPRTTPSSSHAPYVLDFCLQNTQLPITCSIFELCQKKKLKQNSHFFLFHMCRGMRVKTCRTVPFSIKQRGTGKAGNRTFLMNGMRVVLFEMLRRKRMLRNAQIRSFFCPRARSTDDLLSNMLL